MEGEPPPAPDYAPPLPLEDVPGNGDKMRERLMEHGISHAAALAVADAAKLIEIPGIGPHSAAKLIAAAQAALAAKSAATSEE